MSKIEGLRDTDYSALFTATKPEITPDDIQLFNNQLCTVNSVPVSVHGECNLPVICDNFELKKIKKQYIPEPANIAKTKAKKTAPETTVTPKPEKAITPTETIREIINGKEIEIPLQTTTLPDGTIQKVGMIIDGDNKIKITITKNGENESNILTVFNKKTGEIETEGTVIENGSIKNISAIGKINGDKFSSVTEYDKRNLETGEIEEIARKYRSEDGTTETFADVYTNGIFTTTGYQYTNADGTEFILKGRLEEQDGITTFLSNNGQLAIDFDDNGIIDKREIIIPSETVTTTATAKPIETISEGYENTTTSDSYTPFTETVIDDNTQETIDYENPPEETEYTYSSTHGNSSNEIEEEQLQENTEYYDQEAIQPQFPYLAPLPLGTNGLFKVTQEE